MSEHDQAGERDRPAGAAGPRPEAPEAARGELAAPDEPAQQGGAATDNQRRREEVADVPEGVGRLQEARIL